MTKILGLSGRKGSGKNTAGNFILGLHMWHLGLVSAFRINDNGQLWINDLNGDKRARGILDVASNNEHVQAFCRIELDPYIKLYSMADTLKRTICMDILGLTWEQCYGANEDKDSLTEFMWEKMPGVFNKQYIVVNKNERYNLPSVMKMDNLIYHKDGPMTAREVLQFIGTEVFRRMQPDVWVNCLIREIQRDNSELAIITDIRFPNEVSCVKKAMGKVMRFTRNPYPKDKHKSETALDEKCFDWRRFDFIVDNEQMDIAEQNKTVWEMLYSIGWIPAIHEVDNYQ